MASAVRPRPNHYEVLGLTPAATEEEISRAFAKARGMFGISPVAAAAQVCAAFETLRNPRKRQAYDRSLGFAAEPEPRPWAMAARPGGTPIFGLPAAEANGRRPAVASPPDPPAVETPSRSEAHRDVRGVSLIVESLRQRANAAAVEASVPSKLEADLAPPTEAKSQPAIEATIDDVLPTGHAETIAEQRPAEWKPPVLIAGSLVLAVGLVGGLAGLSAGHEAGVTVAVPAAKPVVKTALPSMSSSPSMIEMPPAPVRAAAHTDRSRSLDRAPASDTDALDDIQASLGTPQESPPAVSASDQPVEEAPTAEAVPAILPLPNKVIARTIERIGYSCGEVASATPAGEGEGVFKITCTSGQAYQAAPVHGRYRFRRWGRH